MLVQLRSIAGPITINPDYVTHIVPGEMLDGTKPNTTPNCTVHVNGGGIAGIACTIIGSLDDITKRLNRSAT